MVFPIWIAETAGVSPHAHPDPSGTILRSMWPGHVQLELFLHQLRAQGGWEDDDGSKDELWRVYDSKIWSHQSVSIVRIFTQFSSILVKPSEPVGPAWLDPSTLQVYKVSAAEALRTERLEVAISVGKIVRTSMFSRTLEWWC